MRARAGVRAAAFAAVALAPGGASAAPPAGFDAGASTRFALAGERVLLFSDERPELRVREPGGAVRELFRARGASTAVAEVAATATHVAFVTEDLDAVGEGGRLASVAFSGPLGGPFTALPVRSPHDVAVADPGVVVSGDRGVVLHPAAGGAPVRLGGTGREHLAVGGRFLATRTAARAAVYDLDARREVRSVAVAADASSRLPPTVGVAADGTLVVTDDERRLWAIGPGGHRTLLLRGVVSVAGVTGSTVHAVRSTSGDAFEALQRLWAVDLAGGPARPVSESLFVGDFVTDGARVVYRRTPCTIVAELPVADLAPLPAGCPRQAFNVRADERQRGGRVRVRVTCPGGTADRCAGTARLTVRRASGSGRAALGTWRFAVAGGRTARGTIVVRRRIRAGTVARLRVTGTPYAGDRRIVLLR